MGHQEDKATPCGNVVNGSPCGGYKVTIYIYDDNGNCISQYMQGCNLCGQ